MKLVMTLIVRDEADILDAQLAFHLNTGVDFVLAIDHRSQDETIEILQAYEREGHLRLLPEPGEQLRQAEWMTRLARLAATEHGADWVFCSDADEFWLSPHGSLKELLSAIPRRYGLVRGVWRHFVPRSDDGSSFAERMIVRTMPIDRPDSPFRPQVKIVHRAHPRASVRGGNHDAYVPGLLPLRGWYPIEVLHFPIRTPEQCSRKYRHLAELTQFDPGAHPPRQVVEHAMTEPRALFESLAVGEEALERGLSEGTLAVDTRVRDALRLWQRPDGGLPAYVLGDEAPGLELPRRNPAEAAAFARDVATVAERDASDELTRRADVLEQRLAVLEQSLSRRVRARLPGSRLVRGGLR